LVSAKVSSIHIASTIRKVTYLLVVNAIEPFLTPWKVAWIEIPYKRYLSMLRIQCGKKQRKKSQQKGSTCRLALTTSDM